MIIVAVAAFCGGIISALLGWLESNEKFMVRKFARSVVASVVAGIIFAVSFNYGDTVGIREIFLAVLGGAGVDVLSNRVTMIGSK